MKRKIWKDVVGYAGYYQVSNYGDIRSIKRSIAVNNGFRIFPSQSITPQDNNTGYLVVRLCRNGNKRQHYIHQLVAQAFIPNPDLKAEVNHKNFNKKDNGVKNLEWVTRSENMKHAHKHGKIKMPKPKSLAVYNLCNGEKFNSIKEASLATGIDYQKLKRRLKRKKRTKEPSCLQIQ